MALDPRATNRINLPGDLEAQSQQQTLRRQSIQANQAELDQIPMQRQQEEAKARHQELLRAKEKIDMVGSLLSSAVDEPTYQAAKAKAQSLGLDVSQEPPTFDPNYVLQATMSLVDAKDRVTLALKEAESALDQELTRAKIGTEGAQAGAYGALANQRNAAASLNSANARRVSQPQPISGPTNNTGTDMGAMTEPMSMTAGEKRALDYNQKQKAISSKALASTQAFHSKMENITKKIDEVLPRIGTSTSGFVGSKIASIPGTSAHDLEKDLDTIKANFGFQELQEMRNNSPTGGALGAVTERELALLQSVYSNLENSQSPSQLKKNLGDARKQIVDSWNRVSKAYNSEYGGQTSRPTTNVESKLQNPNAAKIKAAFQAGKMTEAQARAAIEALQ